MTVTKDGSFRRIELDTNAIERAIRPIALVRRNGLFAGSDGGARRRAIVAILVVAADPDQKWISRGKVDQRSQ